MRQPPHHGSPGHARHTTLTATRIRFGDTALQYRTVRRETLPRLSRRSEPQLIKTAESGQDRRSKGSVEHVEVLQMVSVRTSIFGDLDPYSDTNPPARPNTPFVKSLFSCDGASDPARGRCAALRGPGLASPWGTDLAQGNSPQRG